MTVSTHVLDAVAGRPAAGVTVTLARLATASWPAPGPDEPGLAAAPGERPEWQAVESGATDSGGRHRFAAATPAGTYRLTFATGPYFAARSVEAFYPEVTITFMTGDREPDGDGTAAGAGEGAHYHVPLLLSPYAYSTYRGS